MPSETFAWDRKDLLRDGKHERSWEPQQYYYHPPQHQISRRGGGYGGVGGVNGGGTRWREQQHFPYNPHHPYSHPSPKWISNGRGRAGPPGYVKQGGRPFHPEEEQHGFVPSRSFSKPFVDESFRATDSRQFGSNNRESRSAISQKEWKCQYTLPVPSPSGSGRPNGVSTDQPKLVVEVPSSNSLNLHADQAKLAVELPSSDSLNLLADQRKLVAEVPSSNSLNLVADQPKLVVELPSSDSLSPHPEKQYEKNLISPVDKENLISPVDWKSIKRARLNSLPSNSSKRAVGSFSNDTKDVTHQTNVSPIQPSSCDADVNGISVPSAIFESLSSPSEETSSRKKPRLGWGEGLAKYEKKKVVGVDECEPSADCATRAPSADCVTRAPSAHCATRAPSADCATRAPSADCATRAPSADFATLPPSADCVTRAPSADCVTRAPSADCVTRAPSADCATRAPSADCATRSTSADYATRALSDCATRAPSADCATIALSADCATRSVSADCATIALSADCATRSISADCATIALSAYCAIRSISAYCAAPTPSSAVGFSCSPGIEEKHEGEPTFKLENLDVNSIARLNSVIDKLLQSDVQSFGDTDYVRSTAMNKLFVWKGEVLKALDITESEIDNFEGQLKTMIELGERSGLSSLPNDRAIDSFNETPNSLEFQDIESPGSATSKLVEVPFSRVNNMSSSQYDNRVENCSSKSEINEKCSTIIVNDYLEREGLQIVASDFSSNDTEDKLHRSIWAFNRDNANRAADELSSLLPDKQVTFAGISCVESSEIIKAKLLRRKKFQQFKERVIAVKFKVLQHSWKENVRSISSKKFRVKAKKKLDHSSRAIRIGFSSPAGKLTPNAKTIKFVGKLISNSQFKPLRPELKMPSLILDNKEKMMRFVSSNGKVEDPLAVEKERPIENYWSEEEIKIFMDNLVEYGKDFTKIASFLTHKTTGDCIEFYYKNHKSNSFKKGKKNPESAKQGNVTDNYLVTSGKRLIREECVENQQKIGSRNVLGTPIKIASSLDVDDIERETVAADVLAGICSSLSNEVGYREPPSERIGSSSWRCLEAEVDETDLDDWTDEEKALFMQAMLSDGNDFDLISERVHTRSRDQCKIFFSKIRTCLALDAVCSGAVGTVDANVAANDVGTNEKPVLNTEVDLPSLGSKLNTELDAVNLSSAEPDPNRLDENDAITSNLDSPIEPDATSNIELIDANYESGHLIIDSQVENLDQGVDNEDKLCQSNNPMAVIDEGTPIISRIETVPHVEEASNICDVLEKPLTLYSMELESMVSETRISSPGNKNGGNNHPAANWRSSEAGPIISNNVASIGGQKDNNHLCGCPLIDNVDESQILKGYATPNTNLSNVNGKLNFFQSVRLLDENALHDQQLTRDVHLQNSIEHSRNPYSQLDGSLGVENPRPSGKVKLFGQILTKPSNNKSSSIVQQNEDRQRVERSFSFRPTEDQSRVSDNGQVTSYGFWDGNRIQTGFSSLPRTAVFMSSKNSSAFGNNSLPSKMDHQLLQSHVVDNVRTLNFNGSAAAAAAAAWPLNTMSLQQRQEMMISGLRRRSGFETVQAVKQTARGIVGINGGIGGGIVIDGGGQCSGVSDPVAAIRLQFDGQASSIISKDGPWWTQGNLGL